MTEGRTRHLAAVMFVDMVGYTALMQEDEELAWSQRDRHRDVLSELIPGYHGEILQHFGDGTLSVFSSAVKAVECAIAIQMELRTAPEVQVRIGIHTGDIVQDKDGVYGDGVNVASRVESLAPAGGVLISGKVFDEIKNHSTIAASSLGRYQLKNVKTPVEIFTITNEGVAAATEDDVTKRLAEVGAFSTGGTPDVLTVPADAGMGERFIAAVKERAIVQWGLTYMAGAWVVLQVVDFAGPRLGWPSILQRGLDLLAFVGFFMAMVVTWFHGARGRQRITGPEVLMVAGLLVVAGLALTTLDPTGSPTSDPLGGAQVETPADTRPSIAVLPFDNFSPNPDDEYFANGIQEDITSALSRIRTLRVPGRSSVEQYRESRPSTRAIAAALGADYILEGSARVVGGTVKITVQLIEGPTDQHIWTEDYDRMFSVEDVIGIQSEVAETVAKELRAVITPAEAARISAVPTESPEAFVLYHRARYRWNLRTEDDVRAAMGFYQEAIQLDPRFAAAYAGLADAFLVLGNWGWAPPGDAYPPAISAAEAALELDSMEANTHATLGGLYLWYKQDWAASEAMFQRAIELDPDHAYAHYWYSALLSAVGRHDEAIRLARQAAQLDPLAPPIVYGIGRSLFAARSFDEAETEVRRALARHPDYGNLHLLLCNVLIALDELANAESACLARNGIEGTESSLSLAILRAKQGDVDEALRQLNEIVSAQGEAGRQPVIEAMVFAALGDVDGAFQRLRLAIDGDYPHVEYLLTHPFFDPLRDDGRFDAFLQEVGF